MPWDERGWYERDGGPERCVMCGEPRLPGSPYCCQCIHDVCPHCFVVHDRQPCDPPTNERNP